MNVFFGRVQGLAQRRFVDAVKLHRQDAASISAVKLMDELFAIDREASEAQMDHAARHRLCREKTPPLLDQIREHILATSKTVSPKSAVGIACSYALSGAVEEAGLPPRSSATGTIQQPGRGVPGREP